MASRRSHIIHEAESSLKTPRGESRQNVASVANWALGGLLLLTVLGGVLDAVSARKPLLIVRRSYWAALTFLLLVYDSLLIIYVARTVGSADAAERASLIPIAILLFFWTGGCWRRFRRSSGLSLPS
jgi:hypothetical protein